MVWWILTAIALLVCAWPSVWAAAPSGKAAITDNLYGTSFVSRQEGWLVGAFGSVFRTQDSGENWQRQVSGTQEPLFGVDFVDSAEGWIAGRSGLILHTENGGERWAPQTSGTEKHLFSIDFADKRVGAAVGDWGAIVVTSNGGTTWEPRPLPRDVILNSVRMVDREYGWIVGESGTILKTEDGGETWNEQQSGVEKNLFGAYFSDRRMGWAVGIDALILHTEDGGESWRVQNGLTEVGALEQVGATQAFDHPSLYAVAVAGEFGFAVGEIGAIFRSSDRGRSWVRQPVPRDWGVSWLRDVHMLSGTDGLMVGAGGHRVMVVGGRIDVLHERSDATEETH